MIFEIITKDANSTSRLGQQIGEVLRGAEIILLESDLGGGKTTLVRGLAEGLGSSDLVTSPTFTISQVYSSNKFELHHYDFYRISSDIGLIQQELDEVLTDITNIVVIEWPQISKHTLNAKQTIHITMSRTKTNEDERLITLSYPTNLSYIISQENNLANP